MISDKRINILSAFLLIIFFSCSSKKSEQPPLFEALSTSRIGLNFTNKLTPTVDFNMLKYMYFYNGAGVGATDFNNDGLIDLFFASNQGQNKLFLNEGKPEGVGTGLKFKDVTAEAKIPNDSAWSTGVSLVDINNDGLMDIYVCRVGNYEILQSHNQLLICQGIDKNGIPFYKDE
ncbi:MAG: VCBS repeat-containing protein, partial [Parafilimonas sp.]